MRAVGLLQVPPGPPESGLGGGVQVGGSDAPFAQDADGGVHVGGSVAPFAQDAGGGVHVGGSDAPFAQVAGGCTQVASEGAVALHAPFTIIPSLCRLPHELYTEQLTVQFLVPETEYVLQSARVPVHAGSVVQVFAAQVEASSGVQVAPVAGV